MRLVEALVGKERVRAFVDENLAVRARDFRVVGIAVLGAQHAPAESWSVTHLPLQFDAAIVVSHVEVGDVWSCSVTEEIHGSVPLQPTT